MCGITGVIDGNYRDVPREKIKRMNYEMRSRGPDGEGEYYDMNLGMAGRRLSIIDRAGGAQPMTSPDEEVTIFENGEIYNFQDLRKTLEGKGFTFRTGCDTEVLVHGYMAWGFEGLLQKLDGMFAIACYDKLKRKLFLARDRYGEKPLFYRKKGNVFSYASSLTSLLLYDKTLPPIDEVSLDAYLALHYVPFGYTIFDGIRRVLPGEFLTVSIDDLSIKNKFYYQLRPRYGVSLEELKEHCISSVRSRLASEVPMGVFLSGGLDSSLIAALAAQEKSGIDTFSIGFDSEQHDESSFASAVARHIKVRHHQVPFGKENFFTALPAAAALLDEPLGDQAILPLFHLAGEARKYVTVVLSGEGADEIFAGYDYYLQCVRKRTLLQKLCRRVKQDRNFFITRGATTSSGFPLLADMETRERILPIARHKNDRESFLRNRTRDIRDNLTQAQMVDMLTWLPDDLLVKLDRATMAHSIEGRAPYLYPAIVEAGIGLSPDEKIHAQTSKCALRKIAENYLPTNIVQRKKKGFILPMREWISEWYAVQGGVNSYVHDAQFPMLDLPELAQCLEIDVQHGLERERLHFALIMLFEWYKALKMKSC